MLTQAVIMMGQCSWFYLPAAAANIGPVLFTFIKWKRPIWERGLGRHKTWRGLISGIVLATFTLYLQQSFATIDGMREISILPYQEHNLFWLGCLFGGGALIGDALKSYLKRLHGVPPGNPWWPFDQIDFIVGSTMFVSLAFWPGWSIVTMALVLSMLLHPAINRLGYRLGLKEVPW